MALDELERSTLLKAIEFEITNSENRINIQMAGSDRLKTLGKIQTIDDFVRAMWQALKIYGASSLRGQMNQDEMEAITARK